jgi:membrane protease YdiL (CAAX protease family)
LSKRPLIEIGIVIGLILATIWVAPFFGRPTGKVLALMAGTVALASNIFRNERLADLGLRFDNFLAALKLVLPATLALAGLILAIGWATDSLHFTKGIRPSRYLWPLAQQYLLQSFLNRRLQDVAGKGVGSVLITALVFAGLHAPNPALMIATFLAGLVWAWSFQRAPNLFALWLSHILLAVVLSRSLPDWLLPNMRVGWSYWR